MVGTAPDVGTFPPALSEAVEDSAATFFCGSCGMTHAPDDAADEPEPESSPGIMSTISFMGDHQWAFALAFPERAAVSIARAFAGFDIPFDSADMGDVVGEIVNVIAGDVVGRLAKKGIEAKMSLPTTVRGRDVSMLVPTDASTTRFSFTGPQGVCRFNLIATPTAGGNPLAAAANDADALTVTPPPAASPTLATGAPAAGADPATDAWAAAMAEAERQMAEQDAADAAARAAGGTPGAAPAEAAAPRGAKPALLYLALAVAVAGWGAFAVVLTREKPTGPPEAAPEAESAKAEVAPLPPLERIDALALGGKFEDGLRACFDAPKAPNPPRPTALALREALCLEGMGRWSEAADGYTRATADPDPVIAAVALLGQARCATQDGSYLLARALANRALLRSGVSGGHGPAIAADARFLKSQATAVEGGRLQLPRDASARKLLSRSSTNGLEWVRRDAPAAPRASGDVFEVHRTLDGPRALKVSAALGQRSSADVIRMAASTAGLTFEATEPALARLNWAVGPVEVDHLTLAEFLNVLTEDTGVVWELKADALALRKAK